MIRLGVPGCNLFGNFFVNKVVQAVVVHDDEGLVDELVPVCLWDIDLLDPLPVHKIVRYVIFATAFLTLVVLQYYLLDLCPQGFGGLIFCFDLGLRFDRVLLFQR